MAAVQDAEISQAWLCVAVAIDCPGRDAFSYLLPLPLLPAVKVGVLVEVPFRQRRVRAVVTGLETLHEAPAFAVKPVWAVLDHIRIPPPLLGLVQWGAVYYRCSVGTFLNAAVPAPVRDGRRPKLERFVQRSPSMPAGLSSRQVQVWQRLPLDPLPLREACRIAGTTTATLQKLAGVGAVQLREQRSIEEITLQVGPENHPLTVEQAAVVDRVQQDLGRGAAGRFLLYGVTGSGKTLVYMQLAERVIAAGQQALLLLPEIGLTPQLAARFRQRFERVTIWHSGFTDGERAALWHRIAEGAADLVIGTRSALFAPLPRLGLIVVDEEHDSSYKQDSAPRYHARDLAVVYAGQLGVPILLGSATPSLESYHNVLTGRFEVLQMRTRPAGGTLPKPELVDMREEHRRQRRHSVLSEALLQGLREVHEAGKQAIVLLNRRGWSPSVACLACGEVLKCRQCDIGLTYHRGADQLRCHYCGDWASMPRKCPACDDTALSTRGMGTEQLAATLTAAVPGMQVLRLDADTVASRQGHAAILKEFSEGGATCLVGTQMVAKGLDFPRVVLVGIVGADQGLAQPDFRANERTFQLISQVAGRAGRARDPGRVVVQAYDVGAPPIVCALQQRMKEFYRAELELRRTYGYPPGNGLCRFLWRGPEEARVQAAAVAAAALILSHAGELPVLGPTPAVLAYLQGQHRWHLLVKAGSRGRIQSFLDELQADPAWSAARGVKVAIDVDPYSLA